MENLVASKLPVINYQDLSVAELREHLKMIGRIFEINLPVDIFRSIPDLYLAIISQKDKRDVIQIMFPLFGDRKVSIADGFTVDDFFEVIRLVGSPTCFKEWERVHSYSYKLYRRSGLSKADRMEIKNLLKKRRIEEMDSSRI